MHDYHKAADVIKVSAKAKETGKDRVTEINVLVGEDSGNSGEGICEGAPFRVQTENSRLRCPECGELFEHRLFSFSCPEYHTGGKSSETGCEVKIERILIA